MHDERTVDANSAKVVWVRKRDGSVVAFDGSKLAGGIFAARNAVDPTNAAMTAQELTEAVLHFLHREHAGSIPSTAEIVETTVKVLRETGHGATAAAYFEFGRDRRKRRAQIRLAESSGVSISSNSVIDTNKENSFGQPFDLSDAAQRGRLWDKSSLVQMLVEEVDLDPEFARQLAAEVERKLLLLECRSASAGLVRELVATELASRGISTARLRQLNYGPTASQLDRWLQEDRSAESLYRQAGRKACNDYAIEHFFSPDIAGLVRDRLLTPFDAAAPGHWAALSLGGIDLAARCESVDEFLDKLPIELALLAQRTEGVIAIEAFDSLVALLERAPASAGDLASDCMTALEACARIPGVRLVVNLHGCIPDGLAEAIGEGPLFAVRATEQQERFASSLARELIERIVVGSHLENLRIDFHPDMRADSEDFALSLRPIVRHLLDGERVRIAFDRGNWPLADGLTHVPGGRSAAYAFVGIHLDQLHHRLGDSQDDATLFERLGWLVESAIRAAGQKREFVRKRQPDLFAGRDHDRAAAILVPIGLDAVVTRMLGQSLAESPASLAFARQIVDVISQRARRATRPLHLNWRLDGVGLSPMELQEAIAPGNADRLRPGLTACGASAGLKKQLQAAGELHGLASCGTAYCRLDSNRSISTDDIVEALRFAAYDTKVCRIAFVSGDSTKQPSLAEDWLKT